MLRRYQVVLLLGVLWLAGAAVASVGASGQAPPSQDVLGSLLTEVRGLRQAIEQMASSGARVQLALGRLQLQEQRVNAMLRRQEALRDQILAAAKEDEEMRQNLARWEQIARTTGDPETKRSAEAEVPTLKKEAARTAAELQRLQNDESMLAAQISTEQGRWAEINRALEDLERALTRR